MQGNQQRILSVDEPENAIDPLASFDRHLRFHFTGITDEPMCC
ncbi:MAG: hypothetical protein ACI8VC_001994 [Candidatus Endobugula sp.]|jgi:hypothetical protein